MLITSKDNPTFKFLKSLTTSKGRAEHGLCIVEGTKIIFENLDIIEQVFLREGTQVTPNISDLEPIMLSKKLFNEISDLENSDGILATANITKNVGADCVRQLAQNTLVLDRIQDPGNMGTLLRTAAAFGFNNVITINCADVWSQKVIRSAMGYQFKLNTIMIDHAGFVEQVKDGYLKDVKLLFADINGESIETYDKHTALILGNEGQGISKELYELSHKKISIPMQNGVESLNVAVAGGILMNSLFQRT